MKFFTWWLFFYYYIFFIYIIPVWFVDQISDLSISSLILLLYEMCILILLLWWWVGLAFGLWGLHNIFYDVYWIILYASDIKHLRVFRLMNNYAKIGVILKNWSPISPQLLLNIFLYFYGFNCKIFIAIELIFLRRKFLWNLIKIKFKI